jgi:hypothetical protein
MLGENAIEPSASGAGRRVEAGWRLPLGPESRIVLDGSDVVARSAFRDSK